MQLIGFSRHYLDRSLGKYIPMKGTTVGTVYGQLSGESTAKENMIKKQIVGGGVPS
jgi:hypothetical protein